MATWTGPHGGCGDTPTPRDDNFNTILAGDVFAIQESVYTAIYDVLYQSKVADRTLYSQSRTAAHDHGQGACHHEDQTMHHDEG